MADTAGSPKLKIGIVFDDSLDQPDGVQQYILTIGSWLRFQGHEVHYLVGETVRTDIPNLHSLARNVSVKFNGNKLSIPLPVSRSKLAALLRREKFDVLHVQMPYSPWLAHRIIMAAPDKTVIFGTFHIVAYSKLVNISTRLLAYWTRKSMPKYSTIVSVSTAAQAYARQTYRIETEVLPNVFDYPRFSKAKPLLPVVHNKLRILFLGRLVERKGCQYLLEAVNILTLKGISNFEVTVCGKGQLMSKLRKYVAKNNLPVEFTGFVSEDDKPGYYASADIAVFPSTGGESFGIVLVEAMGSGRAVVLGASNSGYASVLGDRPDLQFPVADAKTLADKLEYFLTHADERRQAAEWGQEYSKNFDVDFVGRQLTHHYFVGSRVLRQTVKQ